MSIYELLVKFLAKYFDIFDTVLLEKNLRFHTVSILIDNNNIKDGTFEEFEVQITDEKSLIFRFLRDQIVQDIKVFNVFLGEVSVIIKNRYLTDNLIEAAFKDSLTWELHLILDN